jgi:hypothetical protein
MNPNWLAILTLALWPVVALWLYQTRPVGRATLWTILGAQLVLPPGVFIKLAQGIPQLDKTSIPNLTALFGCMLCARASVRFWRGFGLVEVLLLMCMISPFITSELNGDLVRSGPLTLPSIGHYEAASAVFAEFVLLLPFFLGRRVLTSTADNTDILRTLVAAGLIYSLPMLFEIRMSPQLNVWIYGYLPSDFLQEMREGGFRPVVFMGHGLAVAFFTMTTVVAAAALWRIQDRVLRLPSAGITAYLGVLLVLCKSFGALVYAAVSVPLVRWTRPRLQIRVALVLVTIAISYPLLRIADLVPTSQIVELAKTVSADRANSLETRFKDEGRLLDRAAERLAFGWGRFGRSRIYDSYGRNAALSDGFWIITVGEFGIFGFLAEFGLLVLPVFRAASALKYAKSASDKLLLSSLALILAVNIVDLVPNSGLTPWTWLLAGSLLGRAEALRIASTTRPRTGIEPYIAVAKSNMPGIELEPSL